MSATSHTSGPDGDRGAWLGIERPSGPLPIGNRNPASTGVSRGSDVDHLVGVAGFEPTAPRSQSECATKLRHTPLTSPSVGGGQKVALSEVSQQGFPCPVSVRQPCPGQLRVIHVLLKYRTWGVRPRVSARVNSVELSHTERADARRCDTLSQSPQGVARA